jgi:hypothetical protein
MTPISNGKAAIIRTERGLTIAGTRITVETLVKIVSIEVVGFKIGNQLFVRGKRRDL